MPNCPGAKLSGAKLSWCQIVRVPNCPLLLSWCQIVRFYYLVAKLSVLLSWCQIVWCQIVWCQIVLQSCFITNPKWEIWNKHSRAISNPPILPILHICIFFILPNICIKVRDSSGYQNRWFFEKVPLGGGVIYNPNLQKLQIVDLYTGLFSDVFRKNFAT